MHFWYVRFFENAVAGCGFYVLILENELLVRILIVRRGYILEDALLEISAHCCRKYFEEIE